MLRRLFELVFCGSEAPCGRMSGKRWTRSVEGEDCGIWKDLSFIDHVPGTRKASVPKVVHFAEVQCDEVSTLYDGSFQHLRNEKFDPGEEKIPDDLELRVTSSLEIEDEESNDLEIERRFFSELYSTSLKKYRPLCTHLDGDGSSYSTQRQLLHSWKTESTETTMQTKNRMEPYLTSTQALI